jgi:hypothetical protein
MLDHIGALLMLSALELKVALKGIIYIDFPKISLKRRYHADRPYSVLSSSFSCSLAIHISRLALG